MKLPAANCGVSKRNCAVAIATAFALMSFGAVHLAFHSCSPAGRDLRSATTPFAGISVLLQQAAGYSGEGE